MSFVLLTVGIAVFGLPPTTPRTERLSALVKRGPRLTAHDLLTGPSWEPSEGNVPKMHKLIALTADDDPQKPHFWFRLGATYEWLWDHRRHRAGVSDNRRPQRYLAEAIDAYRAASEFKAYDGMDRALFGLARLHLAADDGESARAYIDRLRKERPTSRYIAQAGTLYADYLFDRGDLAAALAWYSTAEQANDPLTQSYALYRKGWCFLRRGDLDAAGFAFTEAVQTAGKLVNWSVNRAVGRQAERDLAAIAGWAH
jgi:tetratricopeptide (TPR) repeat protein